jgi:VIT1/CCC1 family predicted Fe2+/Mn2+ transporter
VKSQPERQPARTRTLITAAGFGVGPLADLLAFVASPDVLLTVVICVLSVIFSVIWLLARIVLAASDDPTERLCSLMDAAWGRRR